MCGGNSLQNKSQEEYLGVELHQFCLGDGIRTKIAGKSIANVRPSLL